MSHAAFARFGRIVIWCLAIACVVHLYRFGLRGAILTGQIPGRASIFSAEYYLVRELFRGVLSIDGRDIVMMIWGALMTISQTMGAIMVPWWIARATKFMLVSDPNGVGFGPRTAQFVCYLPLVNIVLVPMAIRPIWETGQRWLPSGRLAPYMFGIGCGVWAVEIISHLITDSFLQGGIWIQLNLLDRVEVISFPDDLTPILAPVGMVWDASAIVLNLFVIQFIRQTTRAFQIAQANVF